jgi:peroxidase
MANNVLIALLMRNLQLGGPLWEVALGRRDSRTSLAGNGIGNIPQSNLMVDELISLFLSKGLETSDLVALSGKGYSTISPNHQAVSIDP